MEGNCGECGGTDISRKSVDHVFQYGHKPPVMLTAEDMPVYKCNNKDCNWQWYNWEAEEVMEKVVNEYKKTGKYKPLQKCHRNDGVICVFTRANEDCMRSEECPRDGRDENPRITLYECNEEDGDKCDYMRKNIGCFRKEGCIKSEAPGERKVIELTGSHFQTEPIKVRHANLKRVSDNSIFRSVCPMCNEGTLLVGRDQTTFKLVAEDNCILCGQHFIYTDINELRKKGGE